MKNWLIQDSFVDRAYSFEAAEKHQAELAHGNDVGKLPMRGFQ